MKKIICLLLIMITVFSCSIICFAEPETEVSTTLTTSNTIPATTVPEVTSSVNPDTTTANTQINTEVSTTEAPVTDITDTLTTDSESSEQPSDLLPGFGYTALSISEAQTEITVVIKNGDDEKKITFNEDNEYVYTEYLPVGEYEIVSITSSKDNHYINKYKISGTSQKDAQDYSKIKDEARQKIIITESTFLSINIEIQEQKIPYIVGFLKREWYLLILLIVLTVAYRKAKANRILPSQENKI